MSVEYHFSQQEGKDLLALLRPTIKTINGKPVRDWLESHEQRKHEERTCHWVWMESYNDVTAIHECLYAGWALDCGCYMEPIDDGFDDPDEPPDNGWRFCPYCGAKVMKAAVDHTCKTCAIKDFCVIEGDEEDRIATTYCADHKDVDTVVSAINDLLDFAAGLECGCNNDWESPQVTKFENRFKVLGIEVRDD